MPLDRLQAPYLSPLRRELKVDLKTQHVAPSQYRDWRIRETSWSGGPSKMNTSPIVGAILAFVAFLPQSPPATVDYFPVGVFSAPLPSKGLDPFRSEKNRQLDERIRDGISRVLRDMDEPSLWEDSRKQKGEIYRFIWLRSFSQPIAVRLTIDADGSGDLVAKALSRSQNDNAASLVMNQRSHLPPIEVRSFIEKLTKADFWNLSTDRLEDMYGMDGATWIMEGTSDGAYHIVKRWSPRDNPYRDACMYLALGLARLKIPDREIY